MNRDKLVLYIGCTNWESFLCSDGGCIDKELRCNLTPECPDGEDEDDCDEEAICLNGQLRCHKNNKCVGRCKKTISYLNKNSYFFLFS